MATPKGYSYDFTAYWAIESGSDLYIAVLTTRKSCDQNALNESALWEFCFSYASETDEKSSPWRSIWISIALQAMVGIQISIYFMSMWPYLSSVNNTFLFCNRAYEKKGKQLSFQARQHNNCGLSRLGSCRLQLGMLTCMLTFGTASLIPFEAFLCHRPILYLDGGTRKQCLSSIQLS